MFKALCFDLDGTLIQTNSSFDFPQNLRLGAIELGVPTDKQDLFINQLSQLFLNEHIANSEDAFKQVLQHLNIPIAGSLKRIVQKRSQAYFAACELKAGALDLLDYLKSNDLSLALITNGPADMQLGSIQGVGLDTYFDTLLISGEKDVMVRKPDTAIFKLACKRLKSLPEQTLMVGDNPVADIQGALDAGLQAIQIGNREPQLINVKWVQDLPELLEHFKTCFGKV
jgi:putative hydrolase of the HAD superfamily